APGKQLASFTNSTLCTHFGLSGPSVLDISRYYINAGLADPDTSLTINWLPTETTEQLDRRLQALRSTTVLTYLRRELPERLVEALCREAGVAPETPGHQLSRAGRKALSHAVTRLSLPVTGNRGYN